MNEELKQKLAEMDKEQLISYINLMLDTIMDLEILDKEKDNV